MLKKDLCVSQKALYVSKKLQRLSKKLHHLFKKARHVFKVGVDYTPSQSCSFLLLRSSLHFNWNIQIINCLRMTGHPFILISAVLSTSLHNLPSVIPCVFFTHLLSLPLSVGADPCVCLRTVHFKLSGGHMGPPLQ